MKDWCSYLVVKSKWDN